MTIPVLILVMGSVSPGAAPPFGAEQRALAYLSGEVPRWSRENRCYSCHHNADAARAMYLAQRMGLAVSAKALADTTSWLHRPGGWDKNGGEGPFSDKRLARIQFAATLLEALPSRDEDRARLLMEAARLVAEEQAEDGSWSVVPQGSVGSATTLGNVLATGLARQTLERASPVRFKEAMSRADGWLRKTRVNNVTDAAALLWTLGKAEDMEAREQKKRALEQIRKGEGREGGWGPYVTSSAEVFDTALVLLALAEMEESAEVSEWRRRGRAYLLATQEYDGSWPETTRPSGAESYAQRLSTSGWATRALLVTGRITSGEKRP